MWPTLCNIIYFVFLVCLTLAQTVRRCSPSDISSITFTVNCYSHIDGRQVNVSCNGPSAPKTIAQITCKWGYEPINAQSQVLTCNSNGRWSPPPTDCSQKCGLEAIDGTPLIVGGGNANIQKVPWHVGIYREVGVNSSLIQQCGGTIISAKVIVSAAHCFWNRNENKLVPASAFRVIAGKYYRDLHDPREDNTIQMFGVQRIHLVAGYLDYAGLFANDVAVVVLNNFIEFKVNVAPICIEEYKYEEKVVPVGAIGHVAGWGLVAAGGDPSETLKQINVPVIQREACLLELDTVYHPFLTSDKFCAGFLNGSSACEGDSGGGLVFPKVINGRKFYHLRGIVSSGQYKEGSCDSNKYTLYTNTAHFWDLIQHHQIANRPSVQNSAGKPSHDYECPRIEEIRLVLSQCATNDVVKPCNETLEVESTVTTTCNKGYASRTPIVHKCENNLKWWPPIIPCNAVCGRMPSPPYVPWLAQIHVPIEKGHMDTWFTVAGVIVAERVILTHSHESEYAFINDISVLKIFAGTLSYYLYTDHPNIQRRNLVERFLFQNPINANEKIFAILIVDKPFDFNLNYVAPVCLDFPTHIYDINNGAPVGEAGSVGAFIFQKHEVKQFNYKILDDSICKSDDANITNKLGRGIMCARRPESAGGDNCGMVVGAGFAIPRAENGENIYYLRGIPSTGFRQGKNSRCVVDEFQLFTNINYFKDEIQSLIMKYRSPSEQSHVSSSKLCTISYVPMDGFVSTFENGAIKLEVGNEINHLGVIQYSCEAGFFLIGSESNTCVNGLWNRTVPRCETGSLKVRCTIQRPPANGFALQIQTKYGPTYVFGCDRGFSLPPKYPNKSFCRDGKWTPEIPEKCAAAKPCASIAEPISYALSNCSTNGLEKLCNEAVNVGSTVTKTCKKGYENRSPIRHTCQSNGEWSPPVTNCTATCGRTPSLPHIPWLVKIYRLYPDGLFRFTHSGIIVSERIVLTYALNYYYIRKIDISLLKLFAGSLTYAIYPVQKRVVQERKLTGRFTISNPLDVNDQTFLVLIVDKPFDFSFNHVGPICLDFLQKFSHANDVRVSPAGQNGSVAAFIDFKGGIEQNYYNILDNAECKSNDTNIERKLTKGKMCARRPVSTGNGKECAMVEGSGFVIPKIENGENIHYLKGIATDGSNQGGGGRCVYDEYQLFVNIIYYQDDIRKYVLVYS